MKRSKIGRSSSGKLFRNTANMTHGKNLMGMPMRGGIRM